MYRTCPKCRADVPVTQPPAETCPSCGLIFRKYLQTLSAAAQGEPVRRAAKTEEALEDDGPGWFASHFLSVADEVEPWRIYTGAALLAVSIFFGIRYFLMDIPEWEMAGTFLHTAMVPFHEFGHIAFRPFGEFMTLAGGSLFQWLMPLGFLALFSFKNHDNATAALMLWWCGTQWIDLAPYAWDAAQPQHILLSGRTGDNGSHDYIDTLFDLGLLKKAHQVAWVMHKFGLVLMIVAWIWCAYILYRQWQHRSRT